MAVIHFPKRKAKKPQEKGDMKRALDYAKKMEDTNGLFTALNCNPETAYQEMVLNKKFHHKEDGRLYLHMIQSFPEHLVTPQKAFELGERLIKEHPYFSNYQMVMGTHTDQEHLHNHFIINSVGIDGKKWHLSKAELNAIKEKSLALCREENIPVWWDKKNKSFDPEHQRKGKNNALNTASQGEWVKQEAGKSWKYELFLAIKECARHAHSKDEFVGNMSKLGYSVQWDHHKYITFTTPFGKKCRNNKLYPIEKFTKEALLTQFEKNKTRRDERTQKAHREEMNKMAAQVESLRAAEKEGQNANQNGRRGSREDDQFFPLMHIHKKLEGQALVDIAIKKANATGYNWEQNF